MANDLHINLEIVKWAIKRAGYTISEFIPKYPKVLDWLEEKKSPTINQLQEFSKKVYIPFGYLFLKEIPKQELDIPFFRTGQGNAKVSANLHDHIVMLERRQDWLTQYLQDQGQEKLPFVGKFAVDTNHRIIAEDIKQTLNLSDTWASEFDALPKALNYLSDLVEDLGIIVVSSGVADNNNNRPIAVDECRGFVLVNEYAPFIFLNARDAKAAQLFSLAHELGHIWLGKSAVFDLKTTLPSNDPLEILCNQVAAEFLVPEYLFLQQWNRSPNIQTISRFFKVSRMVVARRAYDLNKISKEQFFDAYNQFMAANYSAGSEGGDFYATQKKRVSIRFASHVNEALKGNDLLYTDAYKMTGLNGDSYQKFIGKFLAG